jgi:CheY-like chemotaxis protein
VDIVVPGVTAAEQPIAGMALKSAEQSVMQTFHRDADDHLDGAPFLSILLVEDEPAHAEIVRRSLHDSSAAHRLTHVEDGQAALDYLNRENDFADLVSAPLPDLILLDLNMPKLGGLEVLRKIQGDEELRKIPSVVLTTSASPADIDAAYRLGATGYQIKPISPEGFTTLLASLRHLCKQAEMNSEEPQTKPKQASWHQTQGE